MTKIFSTQALLISVLSLFLIPGKLEAADFHPVSAAICVSGKEKPVMPELKGFGRLIDDTGNETLESFKWQLKNAFSLEWAEKNFHPSTRKVVSKLFSRELATMMPADQVYFGKVEERGKECVINAAVVKDGKTAMFTFNLLEGKIEALHALE